MKQVKIGRKWYDVENKARWVAQDADGAWFWYKEMPFVSDSLFIWRGVIPFAHHIIIVTAPPEDWTQELYELVD